MRRLQLSLSLLALAGLLAGFLPGIMGAQEAAGPGGPAVVRLYFDSQDELRAVAAQIDVWGVHPEAGYVLAAVTPEQYRWLQGLGYRLETDADKTAQQGTHASLDPRYYYYDNDYPNPNGLYLVDFLSRTANISYTNIAELIDIGDAWQALAGGYHRDMWALRITNEDPAFGPVENKPPFFLFSAMHAREVATPELTIRYIKYLTSGYNGQGGYGVDPDVTWLVDWNVIYVDVMQNPDGHRIDEEDTTTFRRKNMDNDDGCASPNQWGVDLNRNYAFKWDCCGGASHDPCNEEYNGPKRASEPETIAFQEFLSQTVFQDWNGPNGDDEIPPAAPENTAGVVLSLHSYSDLVIWPWGWALGPTPNDAQITTIGRKLGYYTGFTPEALSSLSGDYPGELLAPLDGISEDWTYGKFGVPSYTFEVGPSSGTCGGFFPPYGCVDGIDGMPRNFWAQTRRAFIYLHKIARTPYMTAYGPDAESLSVSPNPAAPGQPVQLLAQIQDHRYGGDPLSRVGAAEYFVDQPGEDGTGTAMAPQDGSWGGTTEFVTATLDTSALAPGRHYILVHGKKADEPDGHWGPFTAVFLDLTPGGCERVQIQDVFSETAGCVITFTAELTGTLPFDYAWDFGVHGASSLPTPTIDLGASGTYPYTLTVTNCWETYSDMITRTATVSCCQAPQEIFFSWSPVTPIVGQAITFTGTASGTAPITYTWDFGDGSWSAPATLTHSITHTYTAAGPYTVTLLVANRCGEGVVSHTLFVVPPPCRPASVLSVTPTISGCVVELSAGLGGDPPFTYSWDLGPWGQRTEPTPTVDFTSPGTYPYTLTVWNCGGSYSATHGSAVTVQCAVCTAVSDARFTWLPPAPAAGETITFTGSASGTAPITYTWDFGDGSWSAPATLTHSITHTYTAGGSYTVTLTATNCGAVPSRAIHQLTVVPVYRIYLPLLFRAPSG